MYQPGLKRNGRLGVADLRHAGQPQKTKTFGHSVEEAEPGYDGSISRGGEAGTLIAEQGEM